MSNFLPTNAQSPNYLQMDAEEWPLGESYGYNNWVHTHLINQLFPKFELVT